MGRALECLMRRPARRIQSTPMKIQKDICRIHLQVKKHQSKVSLQRSPRVAQTHEDETMPITTRALNIEQLADLLESAELINESEHGAFKKLTLRHPEHGEAICITSHGNEHLLVTLK